MATGSRSGGGPPSPPPPPGKSPGAGRDAAPHGVPDVDPTMPVLALDGSAPIELPEFTHPVDPEAMASGGVDEAPSSNPPPSGPPGLPRPSKLLGGPRRTELLPDPSPTGLPDFMGSSMPGRLRAGNTGDFVATIADELAADDSPGPIEVHSAAPIDDPLGRALEAMPDLDSEPKGIDVREPPISGHGGVQAERIVEFLQESPTDERRKRAREIVEGVLSSPGATMRTLPVPTESRRSSWAWRVMIGLVLVVIGAGVAVGLRPDLRARVLGVVAGGEDRSPTPESTPTKADASPSDAEVTELPGQTPGTDEPDEPDNAAASATEAVADASVDSGGDTADPAPPTEAPAGGDTPPADDLDSPTGLLRRAQAALDKGQAINAHMLAKQSFDAKKTKDALLLMVRAACHMRSKDKAHDAFVKLPLSARSAIRSECRELGIDLGV